MITEIESDEICFEDVCVTAKDVADEFENSNSLDNQAYKIHYATLKTLGY